MSTIQRITGTNSGLDVDSLVKSSMKSYQSKIDKEVQNQKISEYQQEQYKQIMSDSSNFYDKYCDILKTGNLMSTNTYNSVSFTPSDPTKVTAVGFAGADASEYTVKVDNLATRANATIATAKLIAGNNLSVTMGSLTIDPITIDADKDKTVSALNKALQAKGINASAKYSEFSGGIVIEAGEMGTGHTFTVKSDGFADIAATDGTNLKGTITKGTQTVDLTGTSNTVTIDSVQLTLKATTPTTETTVATIDADGTTTTTSADGTVTTITIAGGQKTTSSYKPVTLSGSTDITGLKDKIVSFINDYNTLLQGINTKLYEKRDKSFMPLTDDQKKGMTDDQITTWEKKAKTGLLKGDSDLQRIASEMKSAMSSVMSGSSAYLENIGIKPVKNYAEKNGTLTVDETKLTKALQDNALNVKDLFSRAESKDGTDKGGVLTRLASALKSEFKVSDSSLSKKAGLEGTSTQYSNLLTTSINAKKTLIASLNTKYTQKENALYKKYSALETAMQKLNSQQSSLTSMLGTS